MKPLSNTTWTARLNQNDDHTAEVISGAACVAVCGTGNEALSNAARIVACVNGCAGIKHPGQTVPELVSALVQAVEASGFSISGPTDSRAAENGEPAWVCNARGILAKTNHV